MSFILFNFKALSDTFLLRLVLYNSKIPFFFCKDDGEVIFVLEFELSSFASFKFDISLGFLLLRLRFMFLFELESDNLFILIVNSNDKWILEGREIYLFSGILE